MFSHILTLCIMICALLALSNAGSTSWSCVWNGREQKCAQKSDPDGNTAVAMGATSGGTGMVKAGAGTSNNMNTDYQQIGPSTNGESGNFAGAGGLNFIPGFPQSNGPGSNGEKGNFAGAGAGAGGFNYMPGFPQTNGNFDPFAYVRDFMRGQRIEK